MSYHHCKVCKKHLGFHRKDDKLPYLCLICKRNGEGK